MAPKFESVKESPVVSTATSAHDLDQKIASVKKVWDDSPQTHREAPLPAAVPTYHQQQQQEDTSLSQGRAITSSGINCASAQMRAYQPTDPNRMKQVGVAYPRASSANAPSSPTRDMTHISSPPLEVQRPLSGFMPAVAPSPPSMHGYNTQSQMQQMQQNPMGSYPLFASSPMDTSFNSNSMSQVFAAMNPSAQYGQNQAADYSRLAQAYSPANLSASQHMKQNPGNLLGQAYSPYNFYPSTGGASMASQQPYGFSSHSQLASQLQAAQFRNMYPVSTSDTSSMRVGPVNASSYPTPELQKMIMQQIQQANRQMQMPKPYSSQMPIRQTQQMPPTQKAPMYPGIPYGQQMGNLSGAPLQQRPPPQQQPSMGSYPTPIQRPPVSGSPNQYQNHPKPISKPVGHVKHAVPHAPASSGIDMAQMRAEAIRSTQSFFASAAPRTKGPDGSSGDGKAHFQESADHSILNDASD